MGFRYFPPNNEIDFELFCRRFLRHLWDSTHVQRLGKRGERQFGIDLIDASGVKPFRAAQSKHHELDKTIPFHEIEPEVEEAKKYEVPLDEYYVLTTARKTIDVQTKILKLNQEHRKQGLFSVILLCWQDIEEHLDEIGEDHRDWILNGDSGRSQSDLRRMIRETVVEAAVSVSSSDSLDLELEGVKKFLDDNNYSLARLSLLRLKEKSWDTLSDRQKYRVQVYLG